MLINPLKNYNLKENDFCYFISLLYGKLEGTMNKYYVYPEIIDANIPSLGVSIKILSEKNMDSFNDFIITKIEFCLEKYKLLEVKEIDNIIGFNELHRQHGEKSPKIKSAPETLIKLIKKRGALTRISPLVDIYNLISIEYALALGAHDLDSIKGDIVLKFTSGGERFIPIGAENSEIVFPGEYAYIDNSTNEILCRLESRQSDISKLTETSKRILFIIQGNGRSSTDYLLSAKKELFANLNQYYNFDVVKEYNYTGES